MSQTASFGKTARTNAAPPIAVPPMDFVAGVGGEQRAGAEGVVTIRVMTREFDITARALRFYEERGLIAPKRRGRERLYSRRDRGRLRLVLMGKAVGFSLEEIKEMLDLYDLGDGGVTQLKVAHGKFLAQIERLERQRHDIDSAIVELSRVSRLVGERLGAMGA